MSKCVNGRKCSIFLLQLVLMACKCLALPPAPPVTCKTGNSSCSVRSAYDPWPDRIPCNASIAFFPTSEDEILRAVAYGAQNKLKMKVVTGFSHTIPKLVCPGSGDGTGIVISTGDYNKEIVVDRDEMTVTADSGVGLGEIINAAAASGLALAAAPYWEGISLGGLLSTGSHGSSLWGKGGALHEYVVSLRLVVPATQRQGYARIVTLREGDPDLNAARVSLGVLGVISKVTLRVETMFKRNVPNAVKEDADVEEEMMAFAGAHEFGDATWYPYQRRVVYKMDDRAPVEAEGSGVNDFIGFRSTPILITAALRSTGIIFYIYAVFPSLILTGELAAAHKSEDTWEEIEQMAFFKHEARPHWAKNRKIAFLGATAKYPNVPKFLRVMKKYDPDGLFSSDWSDEILRGMKKVEKEDGCALEGLCICEEDRHCPPNEGYLCRPGKVYSDARVCRFHGDNFPSF